MLWIAFGLGSAIFSTLGNIVAERARVDGKALTVWFRIISGLISIPFIFTFSLPTAWQFWVLVITNSIFICLSDVITFSAMPVVGAGIYGRLRRSAILLTFFIWLGISPALISHYASMPLVAIAILLTHVIAVYFALRMKKHESSWQAIKILWIPILFAALAPVLVKLSFDYVANSSQGVFAYIFIQSVISLTLIGLYNFIKYGYKPGTFNMLGSRGVMLPGIIMGVAFFLSVAFKSFGYEGAENPAYISVLLLTDTIWVFIYHRLFKIKDKTDVASGMGIVACAAALILLQIFFE